MRILTYQYLLSHLIYLPILLVTSAVLAEPAENASSAYTSITSVPAEIQGRRIIANDALSKLYQLLDGKLIWDEEKRQTLRTHIENAWKDGLLPEDFHLDIVRGEEKYLSPREEDILLSDALVRLLYQLDNGKVNPETLDQDWNYTHILNIPKAIKVTSKYLAQDDVAGLIQLARHDTPVYMRLSELLIEYKTHADQSGWVTIPRGKVINPGEEDTRLPVIRKRLGLTSASNLENSSVYDEALQTAVESFQHKYGLEVDGVIGARTLKAMNVSPQERLDQIRVNMERARWIYKALDGHADLVVVNIASYSLRLYQDGALTWETDVIVGTDYHKTPVFTEKMLYAEINPIWTLPPGILRRSTLPKFRNDPNYLIEKGFQLYDYSGKIVDSTHIDWAALNGRFPYTVVQPPGPKNALGQIKFIFPNKHNVYLHDTPSRSLFSKTTRAFSHGCIRVKDPLKFAELILKHNKGWDRKKIDAVVASEKRTRVNLKDPLTVSILYWTVDTLDPDKVRFYDDIYNRDEPILQALNAPFNP